VRITTLPTDGTLKLNGIAITTAGGVVSKTDLDANRLTFMPDANENSSPYATLTFQVRDIGAGSNLDLSPNTLTINVKPVNDAPQAGNSPSSPSMLEDAGPVAVTLTGSDLETASGSLRFTITQLPAHGTLTKAGNPLSVDDSYVGSGADVAYAPHTDYNGTDSFKVTVSDRGDPDNCGAAGTTCAAVKDAVNAVSISVISVNDAPAGQDKTVTTNEDVAFTFAKADFGFGDTHDSPANTFESVKISSLPTDGTLKLNGTAVSADDYVSATAIDAGSLKFFPDADEHGSPYATFAFRVRDNGGTANDGVNLDPVANTITINVTAVNDKPVVTLSTAAVGGQYSDAIGPVTVTATDVDTRGADLTFGAAGLPGNLAIAGNADGTTATPTAAAPGTRTATISGRLNVACAGAQPAGQAPCSLTSPYAASITATETGGETSAARPLSITVTREDAQVTDITPYATFVEGTDGDVDSLNVQMVVDEAADGNLSSALTPGAGLANAKPIAVTLTPVATGSSLTCTANNTAYVSGQPGRATASCLVANVPVNVFDAIATIGSNQYFVGGGQAAVTVMDPTLGFTTGGGWFNYDDAKVNFGFNAKILKSGQVQGSVLTIFKRAGGNFVLKSNSMGALAVAKPAGQAYYGATIDGKATYGVPASEPSLAPFCPGVWKCGGYSFRVYVEDITEPGTGADRYWIQLKDPNGAVVAKASLAAAAGDNAKVISGGNIQVPQPAGK
jgi:hypothetical protein